MWSIFYILLCGFVFSFLLFSPLLFFHAADVGDVLRLPRQPLARRFRDAVHIRPLRETDRKSTRLNSSHLGISYAVFCFKKKTRVRADVLAPGWMDYRQHVTYQTYDLTSHLASGKNAIGFLMIRRRQRSTLLPFTTLFRS